jgi:hypothetical protein
MRRPPKTSVASIGRRRQVCVGALLGDSAGLVGGAGRLLGGVGGLRRGGGDALDEGLADATLRTWRSAPMATSLTALAISPTARPASSEVEAICCEASRSSLVARATAVSVSRTVALSSVPWSERSCCGRLTLICVRSTPMVANVPK